MLNILQDDDKIVDLITFIDDPFPKTSFLMNTSSETLQPDHLPSSCDEANTEAIDDGNESAGDEPPSNELMGMIDGDPLIRALIKPHEGIPSSEPFDVHPKQIVSDTPNLIFNDIVNNMYL